MLLTPEATIFDETMKAPVTNAVLEKKLAAYKRRKPASTDTIPVKIKIAGRKGRDVCKIRPSVTVSCILAD